MSRQKLIEVSEPRRIGDRNMGEIFFKRFTFNQTGTALDNDRDFHASGN